VRSGSHIATAPVGYGRPIRPPGRTRHRPGSASGLASASQYPREGHPHVPEQRDREAPVLGRLLEERAAPAEYDEEQPTLPRGRTPARSPVTGDDARRFGVAAENGCGHRMSATEAVAQVCLHCERAT
jgi:hypothetical protein